MGRVETLRPAVTMFAARPARRTASIRCSNRTRVSQTRRFGASARQEAVPRRLPTGSECNQPPRDLGVKVFQRRTPPGAVRKRGIQTGCFESHRGYTQSSHRLQISSSKCRAFPRDRKGTLGAPGAHHVRRTGGCAESSEVGTLEKAITPKPEDDHLLRPLGFERLERDQARGSCETSLLNRAAPSRAHRAR